MLLVRGHISKRQEARKTLCRGGEWWIPLKFTQEEFQFGRADWSISSMTVLGETSWMMEVERERRRWCVSFMPMLLLAECVRMSVPGTDIDWEERLGGEDRTSSVSNKGQVSGLGTTRMSLDKRGWGTREERKERGR